MTLTASTRRIGSAKSATHDAILKAASVVLQEEGAAGLTASNVAKRAGLKAHMVHYYFRSMEDLVLALVRQHGRVGLKNTAQAIASDRPLRALWDAEITFAWGVIAMEFSALAVHYEQIRQEMKRVIEDLRNLQTEGVARHFQLRGIVSPIPPMQLTIIVAAIARQLLREKEFGVSLGHAEMVTMVEKYVDGLAGGAFPDGDNVHR